MLTLLILIGNGPDAEAPTPAAPQGIPETSAPLQAFRPLLQRASTQADVLAALGEEKERNLIRIRTEQNAMVAALADADAWVAANPGSESEPAVAAYRAGTDAIRAAMDEAQAGFLSFDFDRVSRAYITLDAGAAALHRALGLLPDA